MSGCYGALNLGLHVGDDPERVAANRKRLADDLGYPVHFVRQVHGIEVADIHPHHPAEAVADALVTAHPGQALAIMTADCLPIVLVAETVVGIAHGGWRGVLAGIAEATWRKMGSPVCQIWLGPCIGPDRFEVGPEVRAHFVRQHSATADFFRPSHRPDHWLCDLRGIVAWQFAALGLDQITVTTECTVDASDRYFSYRRDGVTGRMATLVWRSE